MHSHVGSEKKNLENPFLQLNWKCERNPIKYMPNNKMDWAFCIMKDDDGYYYIYYVKPYLDPCREIYRMRSSDGKTDDWADNPVYSVLSGKSGTKYDWGTTCPTVWKENGYYHMIFSGYWSGELVHRWRGFYAKSMDGSSWTVQNNDKPIIEVGENGEWDFESAEPTGVIKVGDKYYCWYNDIDCNSVTSRQMGLATSTDLLHWTKDSENPIFVGGRFCPSPIKYGDKYYLFVCHFVGDIFHSEIELYCCDNPTFYPDDRKRPRVVKRWDERSSWEANVLDPVCVLTDNVNRDTFLASHSELWMYYGANTRSPIGLSNRGIGLRTAQVSELKAVHV